MKTLTIAAIIILLLFFAKNLFSVDTEKNYTIINKIENIEIRQYFYVVISMLGDNAFLYCPCS